jgi:hypothetical protein
MLPWLDTSPPITCLSSPQYDDPLSVVATPQFLPFPLKVQLDCAECCAPHEPCDCPNSYKTG